MIVQGIRVFCAAGCRREATWCEKFPGGALYWCASCKLQPRPKR